MEYTEINGLSIPRRFPSQKEVAAYAAKLDDAGFETFCSILKERRWTEAEFAERIVPLRPDHSLFTKEEEVE